MGSLDISGLVQNSLKKMVTTTTSQPTNISESSFDTLHAKLDSIVENKYLDQAKSTARNIYQKGNEFGRNVLDANEKIHRKAMDMGKQALSNARDKVDEMRGRVPSSEKHKFDAVRGYDLKSSDTLHNAHVKAANAAKDAASTAKTSMADKASQAISTAKEKFANVDIKGSLDNAKNKFGEAAKSTGSAIKDTVSQHPKTAAAIGAGTALVGAGLAARKFMKSRKK